MRNSHIAICGAGIAGIATAYYLAVKYDQKNIILIDKNQAMSLTTSKSGENFRDYWPQPCMTALTRHSVKLMQTLSDENNNAFEMRYSGYDFVSESIGRDIFSAEHLNDATNKDSLSRITGADTIQGSRSYLAGSVQQLAHIKGAGAIDVHALGSLLLAKARKAGVRLVRATIDGIEKCQNGFELVLSGNPEYHRINTEKLVLTPGPFINDLAGMLGIKLDVESVLQRKFIIPDVHNVIPRDMPFTIFADKQNLQWTAEEKQLIQSDPEYSWLLREFPAGLHIKPEGTNNIKLGWAYNTVAEPPKWENADDFDFPNITLRGASRFIPGLKPYVDKPPTPIIQFSGYYTRTPENLPLIGPLEINGLFTVSALAGYGTMTACSAGELCADWIAGDELPEYSRYFHPDRYSDVALMDEINSISSDGQL